MRNEKLTAYRIQKKMFKGFYTKGLFLLFIGIGKLKSVTL